MAIPDVQPLDETSVEDAAAVFVRAFWDYPVWTWLMPQTAQRAALLPGAAMVNVRWGRLLGETYSAGSPAAGVAIWVPPAASTDVDPAGDLTGWRAWDQSAGPEVTSRFEAMNEVQRPVRERACPGPHWYLAWLGVDPGAQGGGIGAALLNHMFARADEAALPVLLETEAQRNVAYYERHGFAVVHEGVVPLGGPPFWTMMRTPR